MKKLRGRPVSDNPKDYRVLVRLDRQTSDALDAYAKRSGAGAISIAIRMVLTEKLRTEGLLP